MHHSIDEQSDPLFDTSHLCFILRPSHHCAGLVKHCPPWPGAWPVSVRAAVAIAALEAKVDVELVRRWWDGVREAHLASTLPQGVAAHLQEACR